MTINGAIHDEHIIPPFPTDLRTAPISRIPLSSLLSPDQTSHTPILTACTTHGFFYLDLTSPLPPTTTSPSSSQPLKDAGASLLRTSTALHALSRQAFALPLSTKESIATRRTASLFGYKAAGLVAAADPHQRRDVGEMFNVSKNDMLFPPPSSLSSTTSGVPVAGGELTYPEPLSAAQPLFEEFSRAAHAVGMRVLEVLEQGVGIEKGTLGERHRLAKRSGDHTRLTYGPGQKADLTGGVAAHLHKGEADTQITTYAHTDFGSVTVLFNWLGGLQIESQPQSQSMDASEQPRDPTWQYVQPLPNHAIINLGDAMVTFSGGRLKSGKHRVVQAPGEQAELDRYSVVYFVRPEDEVVLEDLTVGEKERIRRRREVVEGGGRVWKAREWTETRARELGNRIGGGGDNGETS